MKILIVDDSKAMQTIVRRTVEKIGFDNLEFRNAENGEKALDIIRVWEPTLVLSDWHMPEMNGLELLQELNRQMLGVQVGFITTETSEEKQKQAFAAGACFFIQKPFDFETLNQAVKPLLNAIIKEEIEKAEIERDKNETLPVEEDNASTLPGYEKLKERLCSIVDSAITISPTDNLVLNDDHFPCLVGLFEDINNNKLRVIGVMDQIATTILGNQNINSLLTNINKAKENTTIPRNVINRCQYIMQEISNALSDTSKTNPIKLSKLNILKKNTDASRSLMSKSNASRIDLEISLRGVGGGKLTFIAS